MAAELAKLPQNRVPDAADWSRLAGGWSARIDARIAELQRLKTGLTGCIGCGCLSLETCALANPGDRAARRGPGPSAWGGCPRAMIRPFMPRFDGRLLEARVFDVLLPRYACSPCAACCSRPAAHRPSRRRRLRRRRPRRLTMSIVGTNDLHGGVVARNGRGGLAMLGGYVKNLRGPGA